MKIIRIVILTFSLCIILAGCNQGTQTPTPQPTVVVPDLSEDVAQLKSDLLMLQFRVDALESREAIVSTEEQGYSIAKTRFGAFTVAARNATQYLDGFKVVLRIGNLTSANFNGAKLTITWGPPFDKKNPSEYQKNRKKKEFSVTNKFLSGTFSDIEVALTPAKPEDVKIFEVAIDLDQISLPVR